jgi:DNA-directed RNA polymerase subunit RPC12/RpoP
MIPSYDDPGLTRRKPKVPTYRSRFAVTDGLEPGFRCTHCRRQVIADPRLSRVQNRNHCPYCLWSRHMDLHAAGDRLAACRSPMQPVGLTLKQIRKKYGSPAGGELMLIHLCVECGRVSINRIAADDDLELALDLLDRYLHLERAVRLAIEAGGIRPLSAGDRAQVAAQLQVGPALDWDEGYFHN